MSTSPNTVRRNKADLTIQQREALVEKRKHTPKESPLRNTLDAIFLAQEQLSLIEEKAFMWAKNCSLLLKGLAILEPQLKESEGDPNLLGSLETAHRLAKSLSNWGQNETEKLFLWLYELEH